MSEPTNENGIVAVNQNGTAVLEAMTAAAAGEKPKRVRLSKSNVATTSTKEPGLLATFEPAFEALVGRRPTEVENKEAIAFLKVAKESGFDPILIWLIVSKSGQEARDRVPAEMRAIVAEFERVLVASGGVREEERAAIKAAVAEAILPLSFWRRPSTWGWVVWLCARRNLWPPTSWPWPATLGAAAAAVLVAGFIAISASGATRLGDRELARELSTPSGVYALALARANPEFPTSCAREAALTTGGIVLNCRLWAPGSPRQVAVRPTIFTAIAAIVVGWSPVTLTVELAGALIAIAWLWWLKRGPVKRRIA